MTFLPPPPTPPAPPHTPGHHELAVRGAVQGVDIKAVGAGGPDAHDREANHAAVRVIVNVTLWECDLMGGGGKSDKTGKMTGRGGEKRRRGREGGMQSC